MDSSSLLRASMSPDGSAAVGVGVGSSGVPSLRRGMSGDRKLTRRLSQEIRRLTKKLVQPINNSSYRTSG